MKKTYLLLIAILVTVMANAQMVLEYEIPNAGDSIALPLNGTVDVTVDWGDGSEEGFNSSGDRWHKYSTIGTKTVTITGKLSWFGNWSINFFGNEFLTKVKNWDNLGVVSLSGAFYKAVLLTEVPSTLPETVTSLERTFHHAEKFNFPIGNWNTSNVKNMEEMFNYAASFNQPVGSWDTKNVTTMQGLFAHTSFFNQSIEDWNTGKVTNMYGMFHSAASFNQPIGNWNTEKVTNMAAMFHSAYAFNQPIGNWNTSSVTDMGRMFYNADSFNQPIGGWDISKLREANGMFRETDLFNQPIGSWNTENVTNMSKMFSESGDFNQSLGAWDIGSVTDMEDMFKDAVLCTENYDATLNGWASQTIQEGVGFNGGDSKYSTASEAARAMLAESWTITDGGLGTTEVDKCATPLSSEAFSTTNTLEVYPNPVIDKLHFNATSLSRYAIYNLTGNLVETAEVVGSEVELDLSDFATGIYILQTETEVGVQTQRFTKQ